MSFFEKATVEFDTEKTQCADDTLGQVTRSRVMVVKCSPDTYGLIILTLVDGIRSGNPPEVMLCASITEDIKIDVSESSKLTACIIHEDITRWIKFEDEISFWAFTTVIAAAKGILAVRRVDLMDMLETVVSTVPMVDQQVLPQYAQ